MSHYLRDRIRVLLCDDHSIVREGLKKILADTADIEVAGECAGGSEVVRQVGLLPIDLVLLDIVMPLCDGLDVLRHLKQKFPRLPVLVLSTYPEKQYSARCFRLGAAGYLNKSVDPEQLTLAIRSVAAGGIYVDPGMAATFASDTGGGKKKDPHETLSHREYQVFQLIAAGHSVRDIAARLTLSPNTVSTYRSRIFEKTGTVNDVGIALYGVAHKLLDL
jgi:two-component system invasion response regulator UvrY